MTITLPANVLVGTQYWKYGPTPSNPTPHWYQISMGDDDGGLGDDDLTADGVIIDQGGPGIIPFPVGGEAHPMIRFQFCHPGLGWQRCWQGSGYL